MHEIWSPTSFLIVELTSVIILENNMHKVWRTTSFLIVMLINVIVLGNLWLSYSVFSSLEEARSLKNSTDIKVYDLHVANLSLVPGICMAPWAWLETTGGPHALLMWSQESPALQCWSGPPFLDLALNFWSHSLKISGDILVYCLGGLKYKGKIKIRR